jgi:hypothetical protein
MKTKLNLIHKVLAAFAILASLFLTHSLTAQTTNANEFWISTSTNTANLGTLSAPYDGSTPVKFDTIMSNLPPYTTIHVLAGTYQTYGDSDSNPGWEAKSGQKILGSGIDVTILQLVSGRPDGTAVMRSEASTNIEISDLTLDGNGSPSNGNVSCGGMTLFGTKHAIRRVKVINQYSGGSESFGIGISIYNRVPPTLNESDGNIIEECEVTQYQGGTGGISAIAMSGSSINKGGISGIICNNRVFLHTQTTDTGGGGWFAFNGSWMQDVLIEGNYVDGADVGYYGDTGGTTNLIVVHNTFKNCTEGVFYNDISAPSNSRNNIMFAYNTILLTPNANPFYHNDAFYFYRGGTPVGTNISIIGNHVDLNGAPIGGMYYNFINVPNLGQVAVQGLIVADNTVGPNLGNNLSGCANANIYNNYDTSGNYLAMNIPMLGNTPVTSFGLSLVGSAGASPALMALGLPNTPSTIVTNNATGVTLNGTFTGNGSGLTNLAAAMPSQLPKNFASALYSIHSSGTSANIMKTNHGLPGAPQLVRFILVCQTNDDGYVVGDEVDVPSFNANQTPAFSGGANLTNVFLSQFANAFMVDNKTNGAQAGATSARWKAKCYAVYFP